MPGRLAAAFALLLAAGSVRAAPGVQAGPDLSRSADIQVADLENADVYVPGDVDQEIDTKTKARHYARFCLLGGGVPSWERQSSASFTLRCAAGDGQVFVLHFRPSLAKPTDPASFTIDRAVEGGRPLGLVDVILFAQEVRAHLPAMDARLGAHR